MSELPHGTVTLLFTDVEGSTQLQHRLGERYHEVVAEHRRLLEDAFAEHRGRVVDRQTESFFVAFQRARDAVLAAEDAQRAMADHAWPDGALVRVRMGLHSGDPEVAGDRYVGLAVARAARICASAHGGQVVMSSSTRALLSDHERTALRNLGRHRLKDFDEPEPLSQLVVDGLPSRFPHLRTKAAPRRRRRLLIAGAAVVVAGVVATAIVAFTSGGSSSVTLGPTSLGILDPETGRVVDAIDLGFKSTLLAAGNGYIWVIDPGGNTLWKIDPRTHKVARRFGLGVGTGDVPFGVVAGYGAVWVAVLRGTREDLLKLGADAGDELCTTRYATGGAVNTYRLHPLAIGGSAVWAIDPVAGRIWRIDPRTCHRRVLTDFSDAFSLAAGGGAVWAAGPSGVHKLDAVTGEELRSAPVGSQTAVQASSIALGPNAVWFADSFGRTLKKLDPQTALTTGIFAVGRSPSSIGVGEGAVWTANSRDGTVTRLDLRSEEPRTIDLGVPPGAVVAGYGAAWTSPDVRH